MPAPNPKQPGFTSVVRNVAQGSIDVADATDRIGGDVAALPAIATYLTVDQPLARLERIEALLKSILHAAASRPAAGTVARTIAHFQQQVGFLLKYKSYAVKCASPLGYSVFLQQPGKGFSFQRHVAHKVEVFHILDARPGAYVFLCDYESWRAVYDPSSFAAWLAGRADPRFDQYRRDARAGDVIIVDQLNTVHAILGCVVEEFATVSTDMVDRLYDQNAGASIPTYFNRAYALAQLADVTYPDTSNVVDAGGARTAIEPLAVEGGSVRVFADDFVTAHHYVLYPWSQAPLVYAETHAVAVHVTSGRGSIAIVDSSERLAGTAVPTLPIAAGDVLMVLPHMYYRVANLSAAPLGFSTQRIAPDVAFSPDAMHSE